MNVIIYVFIFCCIIRNCKNFYLAYPREADQTIKRILEQFLDYQIIFHFDNKTKNNLDIEFHGNKSILQTQFLVNHEQKFGLGKFSRPKGYKFVHVVYLMKYKQFEKFSQVHGNLKHFDLIIFIVESLHSEFIVTNKIINRTPNYKIKWLKGFDKIGSVFIYIYKNCKFYYVKFYVGDISGLLQSFPNFTNIPDLTRYVNKFNNFNGHEFRVGYIDYPPWIWSESLVNGKNCNTAHGIEGYFLTLLSKRLNFCFKMKDFRPTHSAFWTAMINSVSYYMIYLIPF